MRARMLVVRGVCEIACGPEQLVAYRSRFFQKHGLNPILGDLYRI